MLQQKENKYYCEVGASQRSRMVVVGEGGEVGGRGGRNVHMYRQLL